MNECWNSYEEKGGRNCQGQINWTKWTHQQGASIVGSLLAIEKSEGTGFLEHSNGFRPSIFEIMEKKLILLVVLWHAENTSQFQFVKGKFVHSSILNVSERRQEKIR